MPGSPFGGEDRAKKPPTNRVIGRRFPAGTNLPSRECGELHPTRSSLRCTRPHDHHGQHRNRGTVWGEVEETAETVPELVDELVAEVAEETRTRAEAKLLEALGVDDEGARVAGLEPGHPPYTSAADALVDGWLPLRNVVVDVATTGDPVALEAELRAAAPDAAITVEAIDLADALELLGPTVAEGLAAGGIVHDARPIVEGDPIETVIPLPPGTTLEGILRPPGAVPVRAVPTTPARTVLRSSSWEGYPPAAGDVVIDNMGLVYVVEDVAAGPGPGQWRLEVRRARLIRWDPGPPP